MLPAAAVLALLLSSAAANLYLDSITATDLLGNHFGFLGRNATFDYVVVGGGTAGLTAARRLAENGTFSVAVIEAGGFASLDSGNLTQVPAYVFDGYAPTPQDTLMDWYITTTPQPGWGGRSAFYPAGKTFGGSSARNVMFYQRTVKGAFDKWAAQVGDDSYKWDNIYPYLQLPAHYTPPDNSQRPANASQPSDAQAFCANGGPLQVSYFAFVSAIDSWYSKALSSLGLGQQTGFNSGVLNGWAYTTGTVDPVARTRSSAETSMLRDSLITAPSLTFYKNTLAQRILFDASKRATGVQVSINVQSAGPPTTFTISANKEVILSAGAFRSPQLLMLSGIGPKATLDGYNIPVLSNLAGVGQNMWDHVMIFSSYEVNLPTYQILNDPVEMNRAVMQYRTNRTGMLTTPSVDLLAFERFGPTVLSEPLQRDINATFTPDWPHIELLTVAVYQGAASNPFASDSKNYVASYAPLMLTFSRGNVTLNSTDPADNPVVSPNWLLDPRDKELAVAAFKRTRQVYGTAALKPVVVREAYPGANITSDADILKAVEASAQSFYHACGTNKMGAANDTTAVLDSKARVRGVSGLRVVDASAFPFLPAGQPQGNIYGFAEKLAADILAGR